MALPRYSSNLFRWKDGVGSTRAHLLSLSDMPTSGFYIKSERTGAMKLFLYDSETMEANEFFDGEAMAFMSPGGNARVVIWAQE